MSKSKSKKKKKQRSAEDIAIHQQYVAKQRRKSNIGLFVMIIAVIGIVVCIMALPAAINGDKNPYTYSEYEQLTDGMTYDEVCGVLGGEGDLQTGSAAALEEGDTSVIALYTWANKNGSSVSVSFSGGKVQSVAQTGLDGGK